MLFCLFLLPPLFAGAATLSIRALQGEYVLTFDASRVSEARIKRLYRVAPEMYSEIAIPPTLEMCVEGDPEYLPCGTRNLAAPNFFRSAETNLRKGRRILKSLSNLKPPPELEPVARYVKKSVAFYLCIDEKRLAYYRSWDPSVLAGACEGVDATLECLGVLEGLKAMSSMGSKYNEAQFALRSCMNMPFRKQLGEYPLEAWQRFLTTSGIQEEFIEDDID